MKHLGIALLTLLTAALASGQWVETAGPTGGTVQALSVSAANGYVYAQSVNSIHRSTDGGTSWTWVTGSLPADLAITGLYATGTDVYFSDGTKFYHSTDNGGSWTSVTPTGFPILPLITTVTSSGSTLLCGINGVGFGGNGVYASTNHGAAWTLSSTGLPTTFVPGAFAAIGSNLFVGASITFGAPKGVYLSTNGGASWTMKDTTLSILGFATSGTTLYATTLLQGIRMSTDNGTTWSTISANASLTVLGAPSIVVAGSNLYVGTAGVPGIYKVNLAGTTWDSVATGLPPRSAGSSIASMAVSGGSILAAFAGQGIFRSTNAGALWTKSNAGLRIGKTGGVYANGAALYASGITTGYFRSSDHGDTWTEINTGLDLRNTGYYNFIESGGYLLGGGGLQGVSRSADAGDSWSTPSSIGGPAYSFISDGSSVYSGTLANVVKSTDNGTSWNTLVTGNPSYIAVVAVWKDGPSLMAGASAGFKRSTDDGATWTAPVSGLLGFGAYHGFAQIDTTVFLAHDQGVYRSTDHGATWTSTPTFGLGIAPIALHTRGQDLYAGTSKGVYRSTNLGSNWTAINEGLPASIFVNALTSDGQYLYAGMNSHSVWRRPLAEITDVRDVPGSVPVRFAVEQNYPNPFNPATSIRYHVAEARRVTVTVYDILGRELARLVDREQQPGTYEAVWNAASSTSGIYYYRIEAGTFSAVRSMLLVK